LTIRSKLLSCLALLAFTMTSLGATAYVVSGRNEAALHTVLNDRVVPLEDLKTTADSYAVGIVDAAHKARNGNISFAAAAMAVRTASADITAKWAAYRATRIVGEEEILARKVEQDRVAADRAVQQLQTILQRGDRAALDQFVVQQLYPAIDPVSGSISELVSMQIRIARDDTYAALSFASWGALLIMLFVMVGFGALAGSLSIVLRQVIRPLTGITDVMASLAGGKNDIDVPAAERADEIGAMAKSVIVFRDAARAQEQAAQAKTRADADQKRVVATLGTQLKAVSRGDLTCVITEAFPSDYEGLRDDFNATIASLRTLIASVADATLQIRTGASEIARASEDLARRTEGNAASLEETSAAVTKIDTRLSEAARTSLDTVQRADRSIETVKGGRETADKAVAAMSRVSESARGIDGVIEGLDKIAFQTRVLAMNAAVEAGRAGDAGRGFAVVADLVSALAMRAEDESKRARDQLTATQADIGLAVDAVQKVDSALSEIVDEVGYVHGALSMMAQENQAQAATVSQISVAVGAMDQATQQNAAMVEETSAAARNLTVEAMGLAEQAERFRVEDGRAPTGRLLRSAMG
jgi:methyl-accepting chemotaxis protein